MKAGERQLTLVVPLSSSHPDAACHWIHAQAQQLPCGPYPALGALLGRADPYPVAAISLPLLYCEWFGIRSEPVVPFAALRWLADTGEQAEPGLLCLDPVQLLADKDHVLLYDSTQLQLDEDEVVQLVGTLNEFLAEQGLWITAPTAQRWYLSGAMVAGTQFTPVEQLIGRNIMPAMPRGDSARDWRSLLNELQILLHVHPVNVARAEQGMPTLNGVWPWGAGDIEIASTSCIAACFSDNTLLEGMSRLQGVRHHAMINSFDEWHSRAGEGHSVVVLPDVTAMDTQQLCEQLDSLEQQWFRPLCDALVKNQCQQFTLITGPGIGWRVNPAHYRSTWRRWFRRDRNLVALCERDSA